MSFRFPQLSKEVLVQFSSLTWREGQDVLINEVTLNARGKNEAFIRKKILMDDRLKQLEIKQNWIWFSPNTVKILCQEQLPLCLF